MTDLRHLIQDLRAEAPNAAPGHGDLMRQAAVALDELETLRMAHGRGDLMSDADVRPPPFPPPADDDRRPVKGAPCR